jgi:hypothetical protein
MVSLAHNIAVVNHMYLSLHFHMYLLIAPYLPSRDDRTPSVHVTRSSRDHGAYSLRLGFDCFPCDGVSCISRFLNPYSSELGSLMVYVYMYK